MSLISFSQRILRNEAGDTSICFTIEQSRILLRQINRLNYLDSLNNIDQEEINTLQNNLEIANSIIKEKDVQISIKNDVIETKDEKINDDKLQYQNLKNLLLKEKIKKWVAILTGTATTGFMTYLWISKE